VSLISRCCAVRSRSEWQWSFVRMTVTREDHGGHQGRLGRAEVSTKPLRSSALGTNLWYERSRHRPTLSESRRVSSTIRSAAYRLCNAHGHIAKQQDATGTTHLAPQMSRAGSVAFHDRHMARVALPRHPALYTRCCVVRACKGELQRKRRWHLEEVVHARRLHHPSTMKLVAEPLLARCRGVWCGQL